MAETGNEARELYIKIPNRGFYGKGLMDVEDIKKALAEGAKEEIPGESKVIEGKFPTTNNEEKSKLVDIFNNVSNKIEESVQGFLGISNEDEETVDDLQEPEKIERNVERDGNIIKVDFKKK